MADTASPSHESACLLCQEGRCQEAQSLLVQALASDADDPLLWNDLGVAYWLAEAYSEAEAAFRRALEKFNSATTARQWENFYQKVKAAA